MVTQEHAEVRGRILEEAARLFVSLGYHGISMREIAEASGVSKAGIYYHFRDKEHLFLEILRANLEAVEQIVAAARKESGARSQVEHFVRGVFERAPDQRAMIRLASQEMPNLSPEARAEFGRLYRDKFVGQVEALLEGGMERGEIAHVDVHQATWILLGMMYPFFYPSHTTVAGPDEQAVALTVRVFFDGLSVPKG